jgi:hypothetical protein
MESFTGRKLQVARRRTMADTSRLQVDILKQQLEELDDFQKLGGLRSKRELWDTAFTLLKWAAKKKAQGSSVGSRAADGSFTELEMAFLEHYAEAARKEAESKEPLRAAKSATVHTAGRNGGRKMSLTKRRQTA